MKGTIAQSFTFFELASQLAEGMFREGVTVERARRISQEWLNPPNEPEKPKSIAQAGMQACDILTNGLLHAALALAVQPDMRAGGQSGRADSEIIATTEILRQLELVKNLAFTGWQDGRGKVMKTFSTPQECKIARFVLKNLSDVYKVPLYDLAQLGETQLVVPVEALKQLATHEGGEHVVQPSGKDGVAGRIGV